MLLDAFSALADKTRCRMMALIDRQELTVSELCSVLQLPQSTVSRHLKTLADAGWVTSRRNGTSRYYAVAAAGADDPRAQIWQLTRAELAGRPGAAQDERRVARVLADRSRTSQEFFANAAGRWDRVREDLFGSQFSWQALLGLLPPDWVVADLGCGTGVVAAVIAPHVGQVIGVDASDDMLAAARVRVKDLPNVALERGALEALPLADASVDAAVMMLVLHHLPSPAPALSEAARILKPGGRLLIVDMLPHDREEYRQEMGHVWLGFSAADIARLLDQAGFEPAHVAALPPQTDARGPSLFAATAARTSAGRRASASGPAVRREDTSDLEDNVPA